MVNIQDAADFLLPPTDIEFEYSDIYGLIIFYTERFLFQWIKLELKYVAAVE